MTPTTNTLLQPPEGRCTQCGEKLPTQQSAPLPPARRTEVKLCSDCSTDKLPHTD